MGTIELKHVLLVEDNVNDIELTLAALAQSNLANDVVVVRDGQECLDYLHRAGNYSLRSPDNPAVVLLDLKLPKIDGMQVLERLKMDPAMRMIPVVMLTSSREEQDLARSYLLGVNAYVVKPIDFKEFVLAIKELGLFWAVVNTPPPGSGGPPLSRPEPV